MKSRVPGITKKVIHRRGDGQRMSMAPGYDGEREDEDVDSL